MQPMKACSVAVPAEWACSHCVTHAWVVQFIVLMQLMMSPHAAFAVQAAPCAQHFEV
jgi:hypothetical protein